jgi:ligand-binding sensor domain-containing protein
MGDGLFIVDPVSGKYRQLLKDTSAQSINSNDINVITILRNGNIVLGTNGDGINVMDNNYHVKSRYTPRPKLRNDVKLEMNGYIKDIKEDNEGNIWVATHGGGMIELNLTTGKSIIYNSNNSKMPNDKVQSIFIDTGGNIWAGTLGGGLVSFNKRTQLLEAYSEKNGLQNNTVYTVIGGDAGLIWVSTNWGISSVNPITKRSIITTITMAFNATILLITPV